MSRRRFRLGPLREVSYLFPLALLLLVVLSTFTLLAYRSGVEALGETTPAPPGSALAAELARQQAQVRGLSWVILSVNVVLTVLVLASLRTLLAPFEAMLASARAVAPEGEEEDVELLVATFERAIAALARTAPASDEAAIAALENVLGASLDSGVLLVDAERRVLALNPAGGTLLGLEVAAAERPPLAHALAAHPRLAALVEQALAEGRTARAGDLPAGSGRVLGATAHPLRRNDGSVRGALVLFVDLTAARRQAEREQLAQSLAQLGELAAGLAHELRNGMATLRGYLTLIERAPEGGTAADYLVEMRREADHLMDVLEDFLSFARPERLRLEAVDLPALLRRAVADPALGEAAVRVGELPAALPPLSGDPQLLQRALRNLLHNAARAHAEGGGEGPLEVAVREVSGGVEVAISDRGPGLPPGLAAEELFRPFVSGSSQGVGLGLPLAHRIVALHGGSLRLEARADGPGACAVLVLPTDTIDT